MRKALRDIGWVRRFCLNCRQELSLRQVGDLTQEEESASMDSLLRNCQLTREIEDYLSLTRGVRQVAPYSANFNAHPEWDSDRKLIICTPGNGEPLVPWQPIPSI